MSARGKFITLEGVDGSGKSTHLAWVEQLLHARGHDVLRTREPGGTPLAEALRELVLHSPMDGVCEVLLMFAARADHVRQVIRPALEAGRWVVCDRFTDATLAYQGAGKGVPAQLIRGLAEAAHPGLWPDLTLVFDCPYEVASARLAGTGRSMDRFEREDRAFFDRVRGAYLESARREAGRVRLIDASQALEEVKKQIEEQFISY
ncbi:MAG: thymidylate kinase [Betaproteobacteria bacterium SG8_39]|nr:MAG: thymidylate kinase [Betaproteobacteria bacterium SG8_39]